TGDLGFAHDGQLFITGRLKDLIIIRGTNHYPQDIELTVDACHPALRAGSGAAFSVEAAGEERLVIVQEVERQYLRSNLDEVVQAIRKTVAENHELQTYAVVLLKTGTMLKTSSGKVQRRGARQAFLADELEEVFAWRMDLASAAPTATPVTLTAHTSESSEQVAQRPTKASPEVKVIRAWLLSHVAEALKMPVGEIDTQTPLANYGMDSAHAVGIAGELEEWLERELPPTLLYDYPTIQLLATSLAGEDAADEQPAQTERARPLQDDAIAIVGLGCRFPGANNPDEFWQLLAEGRDGLSEVPATRWDIQKLYSSEQAIPGKMNTRRGGFLDQVDQFDPYFFGISPREAERMDPQQRLLLEVAWEALEHAGQAPQALAGSQTGVFVGISSDDYSRLQGNDLAALDAYSGTGNAHSIAANRLSYLLDLRGPSMALDTACSSSLVAVHQACLSLRSGECDLAIAGGVNIILTPDLSVTFSQARMMSAQGQCRTFDESADGYVRSEGCGLVILKPLAAAERAGDHVLGVIRGSAVNQDGRSNGLTAPNGPAQEAVIRQALRNAGVAPAQVSYVETHGSSTPLGDPIEVGSLKAVLMSQRSMDQTCVLGAVKSNIGHLESAAGIAGLIKTVLSLQHAEIPPNVHFTKLNPHISLDGTSFVIPTRRQPWPVATRRIAGVSAFGFGGTNAHIILEAAPDLPQPVNEVERTQHLFTLSARSDNALQQLATRYESFLAQKTDVALADICFTTTTGRAHFDHRLAIVADSPAQLRIRLANFRAGGTEASVVRGQVQGRERPKVAFLFTGQGSQYVGMARELYETQPTFRAALDACDHILRAYLEHPLLSIIYPGDKTMPLLHETMYTQPALFALEYALAQLWQSWGVEPDVVMGHSIGEYVAACVAGILSLEDGLKLIAQRARLMQALPERGTMVVVFAEPERVAALLAPYQDKVSIAVINGPRNTVISGTDEAVRAVRQRLEAEGLDTHPMQVSHAFHSPVMEPMLETFEGIAREVKFAPARIPLVCNLNGRMLNVGETLDASYWRQQARSTVQFAASMQTLAAQGYTLFVELGPNAVLSGMGKRCLPAETNSWLPSLRKEHADWSILLQSVASLYTKGIALDWVGFEKAYARRRVALPTYPFERERCWFAQTSATGDTTNHADIQNGCAPEIPGDRQRHPLLAGHVELVHPTATHMWEVDLDAQRLPYLQDHRIQGAQALPVSVYVEMAQAASTEAFGTSSHVLTELQLKKLLLLPERGAQKVQVVLSSVAHEQVDFHVYSHSAGIPDQPRNLWTLHASGKIRLN
ncbi:MAG TPA: beta-ketoacyl synthase N-terminal-like domain-containing protein, partial [Ktedonobacteraceae bacterium]|nr:beta-ketoacyl synthase N-terminal-like domain-containing protein [Ktedonobacteraceae bacterium]